MNESTNERINESSPRCAVVLLSGGVDSSTLLHYVVHRLSVPSVHAVSFRYGQKHGRELEMALQQAGAAGVAEHRIVDAGCLGDVAGGASALTSESLAVPDLDAIPAAQRQQPPTYVPNRNLTLLSLAAAYAESMGAAAVYYGAQAQDEYGYWDCTAEFLARLNELLALNRTRPVAVHAPFVGMRKADIVKLGLELGVDYSRTWTCYRGADKPCGTCPSCVERSKAFEAAGVADPLLEG